MDASTTTPPDLHGMSGWQRWLHHPESLWPHRILFHIHMWVGIGVSLYILVMSVSGSVIVNRDALESSGDPNSNLVRVVEWLVDFHENLLSGSAGRFLNGVGAICLTLLCLTGAIIWWPGIAHWRRSLTVNFKSGIARVNWDLHNALGLWFLLFVLLWGVSGFYFCFPRPFNAIFDPPDPTGSSRWVNFGEQLLLWLSNLHFGRFSWFTEAVWTLVGLVPAVLAFTGMFMCCHRIFRRGGARLRPSYGEGHLSAASVSHRK